MPQFSTKTLLILVLITAASLRLFKLPTSPASLYWDEMDIGYQVYSLLQTGKDYFGNYPGLVIHSFADFRAPLLIYATIPFVALLGLGDLAIKLPAAIFGILSVFLSFILARILFKSPKAGLIAALFMAFEPWNLIYSRMAFEATLMLSLFLGGTIAFLKGINNKNWFIASGILFALTLFTYNTSKLFIPLIVLVMILIYIRKKDLTKKFLIGMSIFGFAFIVSLYTTLFQGGGQRFAEISILTDPQIASKIDNIRLDSALSYADNRNNIPTVTFLDKIIYNKPTYILDLMTQNYLKAFSTDFLFISGDPNLRHSTGKFGEFFRIEVVTIILGLGLLLLSLKKRDKNSLLFLFWIILAPLPAVITKDGGTHATRLFFLFPALTFLSASGLLLLWQSLPKKINLIFVSIIGFLFFFSAFSFLNYYFGLYKLESAKAFQYGFSEAVAKAVNSTKSYDYVIIDDRKDSALMNYLYQTKYNPAAFQSEISNLKFEIAGAQGDKIGNIIMLKPGSRNWVENFDKNLIKNNFLLIVSALQFEEESREKVGEKLTNNQKLIDTIYYLNGNPAFYIIESKYDN